MKIQKLATLFALLSVTSASAADVTNWAGSQGNLTLISQSEAPYLIKEEAKADRSRASVSAGELGITAKFCKFAGQYKQASNATISLVQFRLPLTNASRQWFCWELATISPDEFRVFWSGTNLFASYVCLDGLKLFRPAAPADAAPTLSDFLETGVHRDALPTITTGVLESTAGANAFLGENALHWAINVDNVTLSEGAVHVRLHGVREVPVLTFALTSGAWTPVSSK